MLALCTREGLYYNVDFYKYCWWSLDDFTLDTLVYKQELLSINELYEGIQSGCVDAPCSTSQPFIFPTYLQDYPVSCITLVDVTMTPALGANTLSTRETSQTVLAINVLDEGKSRLFCAGD